MKLVRVGILCAFLLGTGAIASAAAPGFYFGGGGGPATFHGSGRGLMPPLMSGQPASVKAGFWTVFAGYDLSKWTSVELGYFQADSIKTTVAMDPNIETFAPVANEYNARITGYTLAPHVRYNFGGRFSVFANAGMSYITLHQSWTPMAYGKSWITKSFKMFYGLGGEVAFSDKISGRLQWNRYEVGGSFGAHYNVWFGSLVYHF